MAKTTIQQSEVNFTVETGKKTHVGWDKKYTNINNILNDVYDPDPQNLEKSINAVEIDWNGATWTGITGSVPSTINTTGDLLKAIKYASTVGGSDSAVTVWNAPNDVVLKTIQM